MTQVTVMGLYNNELSGTFDPTPFRDLGGPGSVFFLRLDNNRLSSIGPGAFAGISGLGILILSGNVISSIDDDAFVGLNELGILDFSNNIVLLWGLEVVCNGKKLMWASIG